MREETSELESRRIGQHYEMSLVVRRGGKLFHSYDVCCENGRRICLHGNDPFIRENDPPILMKWKENATREEKDAEMSKALNLTFGFFSAQMLTSLKEIAASPNGHRLGSIPFEEVDDLTMKIVDAIGRVAGRDDESGKAPDLARRRRIILVGWPESVGWSDIHNLTMNGGA